MKKLKFYEEGAVVTMIIVGVGWLALGLSAGKVGEKIYEKEQTDRIAEQLQEQSEYLAEQAPKLGKSGDEAVRESMRLNEAAKEIKKEGLRGYSAELLKEGLGLSLGLQLGTAGKLGEAIGHGLNIMAVGQGAGKTVSGEIEISESDLKIWETIKGSRNNVDMFELARYKAELDEIARMKGEIANESREIQKLLAKQKQSREYWEQLQARRKREREKARERALEKEEIKEAFKERVKEKEQKREAAKDKDSGDNSKIGSQKELTITSLTEPLKHYHYEAIAIEVPQDMTPPFEVEANFTGLYECPEGHYCSGDKYTFVNSTEISEVPEGMDFEISPYVIIGQFLPGGKGKPIQVEAEITVTGSKGKVAKGSFSSETACIPHWECSAWSECQGSRGEMGHKTRECWDNNNCGDNSEKPLEKNNCYVW